MGVSYTIINYIKEPPKTLFELFRPCTFEEVWLRVCLDPKEPTFSGLLLMTSSYKPFKNGRLRGLKVGFRLKGLLAFAAWIISGLRC